MAKIDQIALVTGATGAIGKAIARQIAEKGYQVVIIARDEAKARRVVAEIRRTTSNQDVSYEITDLSRLIEIQALAKRWRNPLNILINNAAVTPPSRKETPEGIELQFATNVLGYFWMTREFREILIQSKPARIIDVASYWAGGLNMGDLEFKVRPYRNGAAYRQSKQANRMLSIAWSKRLIEDGITINACHPGDVNSKLSNNLGFGGSESPDKGASTPVWLATNPAGGLKTGKYFENMQETHCQFGDDHASVETLYEICLSYS